MKIWMYILCFCFEEVLHVRSASTFSSHVDSDAAVAATLGMDEAVLTVSSQVNFTLHLSLRHAECDKCPLSLAAVISPHQTYTTKIQTKFATEYEILHAGTTNQSACRALQHFREGGDYVIMVNTTVGSHVCSLILRNQPDNNNLPILYVFLVLLGLALLWGLLLLAYRKGKLQKGMFWRRHGSVDLTQEIGQSTTTMESNLSVINGKNTKSHSTPPNRNESNNKAAKSKRLKSLDTLRGLSLTIMIFVNYGGGGYYFFEHAIWNGLMVADLVFPWFVFIMGTAIALALRGLRRKKSATKVALKILRRLVILFAIGLFLGARNYTDMRNIRIPGVLQRLALTYFGTAIIHLFFVNVKMDYEEKPRWWPLRDIVPYWLEWLIHLAILAVYLGITFGLPVPGCPTGYLGPGGYHEGGKTFNCSGGAAGYIDRLVLTSNHIYNYPTFKGIYGAWQAYDPEGILGTLSCIFMCFIGLQAGKIVLLYKKPGSRMLRWIVWGILTGGLGTLLCKASLNDGWVPLNKNLWSVSFVFVLTGTAFLLLAFLFLVIDHFHIWNGAPFIYPGMNSIVIYVCHSVFAGYFPVSWYVDNEHWKKLVLCTWSTGFWLIVAYVLYRKKIFVAI